MNTRKDFWRAVEIIRAYSPDADNNGRTAEVRSLMKNAFADFFSKDNPRFDDDRFTAAVWAKGDA